MFILIYIERGGDNRRPVLNRRLSSLRELKYGTKI